MTRDRVPSPSFSDAVFERDLISLIPQVRGFARALCGGEGGDDLAQEAIARAWVARASLTPGTNMKAWLFMILRNRFFSERRRSWRMTALDPEVAEKTLIATSDPDAALSLDEVRRGLFTLPDDQREALILVGAAGLSYEEVAEIVGAAVGTIKSRVNRARRRLAQTLSKGALEPSRSPTGDAAADILAQAEAHQARSG